MAIADTRTRPSGGSSRLDTSVEASKLVSYYEAPLRKRAGHDSVPHGTSGMNSVAAARQSSLLVGVRSVRMTGFCFVVGVTDLCFPEVTDLCLAAIDEVENTHNEPDARKQSVAAM
jgi:hypothetical protein